MVYETDYNIINLGEWYSRFNTYKNNVGKDIKQKTGRFMSFFKTVTSNFLNPTRKKNQTIKNLCQKEIPEKFKFEKSIFANEFNGYELRSTELPLMVLMILNKNLLNDHTIYFYGRI